MNKVLILVQSSPSDKKYLDLMNAQKKTWDSVKIENIKTIFYFGKEDIEKNKIVDEDLIIKTSDSYENVKLKMKLAMEFVLNDLDWNYMFRTNSSTYVDKKRLLNLCQKAPENKFYCGVIANGVSCNYVSGAGMLMSRDVVEQIVENIDKVSGPDTQYDDVAAGKCLKEISNILPHNEYCSREDYNHKINFEDYIKNVKFNDCYPYQYRCKSFNEDRSNDIIAFNKLFNFLQGNINT